MKSRCLPHVLSTLNLLLLIFLISRMPSAQAHGADSRERPGVLRGRALEIVDDQDRVRATLSVLPVDPKYKQPNGKPFPETVLLRLIDPNGQPAVKLGASVQGGTLGLSGASDPTYIQLIADGPDTFLRMTNKEGKQQMLKP